MNKCKLVEKESSNSPYLKSNSVLTLNLSHNRTQLIIWTLLCLMPIVGMAVDLVAPSLPSIAKNLQISPALTKDIISIYLFGYAFGNFFTGFLTDALGRQKLLRGALAGFIFSSLLPVFFPNITILLLARLLQGLGIGAMAVIARAVFSDLLPSAKLVKMGVLIGSMFGLGPVIGPAIGGYLQFYFGWQSCFIFFAVIMFIMFITICYIVPETHFNRHTLNINTIKHNLTEVLKNKKFMALVIMTGAVYSLILTFNTIGPFLIQNRLHYSSIFYGHVALLMGLAFLSATFVCRYLLQKREVEQLFLVFVNGFFALSIIIVITGYMFANNIILICIASAIMFFACGFIFPMSMGKGLSLFRHMAGTATATMYLINSLMTSMITFFVSFIQIQHMVTLFWIYLLLLAICFGIFWKLIYSR